MAQQIKKKFIQNDAVDGQKLKLQKDQSIRGQKQDGSEVELLKLDGSNKLVSDGEEIAFKEVVDAQVSDLQGKLDSEETSRQLEDQNLSTIIDEEVQSLTDLINEESSDIRSEFALADANLQSQVDTEKGRIDAILSASEADKDSFAEIVQLINSVDTTNDQAFAGYVLSNDASVAGLDGRLDILEPKVTSLESGLSTAESNITRLESDMSEAQASLLTVGSDIVLLQSDLDDLDGYAQDIRSDLDKEIDDRATAVSTEASARQSADSIEQGARILADAELLLEVDQVMRTSNDRWAVSQAADITIRGEFALADANLQSQVDTEKGRIDAILLASDADKDSFAEIVQLINSVDVGNDSAFAGYVTSNNTAMASEASARAAADAILQSDLDDLDGYAQDIRSDVDDLDGYAQDIRSDLDSEMSRVATVEQGFDSRLDALEAQTDGPFFSNEKLTVVAEQLDFVELAITAMKIMSCAVGRLAVHEGEDFDVTVVNGKSRIVWKGSLLSPSGEEAIEAGMNVFVVYAY
jgi:hypothetical protein